MLDQQYAPTSVTFLISFLFSGKPVSHTASVRRIANETTDKGNCPQPGVATPHVNSDEKHVSSDAVVVHTEEEEKILNDIRNSIVPVPVPASVKRILGKRTTSQGKRGAKGDGLTYTLNTVPSRLFRPISSSGMVFRVPQEVLVTTWLSSSNSAASFAAQYFTVSSLDQISHLTALFDQYRIVLVECWLCPQQDESLSYDVNLATVIDYDDVSGITYAQALDYVNVVSTNGLVAHYRKFVPHCAIAAYSGTYTSNMNVASPWIDAVSTSVQHYGLKAITTQSTQVLSYDLTYRLTTEWRNVR